MTTSSDSPIQFCVTGNRADRGVSGGSARIVFNPETRSVYDTFDVGNACPVNVWHHRAVSIMACDHHDLDSINEALQAKADLIEDIFALYKGKHWNGNNHVGTWTDMERVNDLLSEIARYLDENCQGYGKASEWLGGAWTEVKAEARKALDAAEGDEEEALDALVAQDWTGSEPILLEEKDLRDALRLALDQVIDEKDED